MSAALYRARADLRRHWRAAVGLALLVGLAGGVVLTTVAGARRSSSAYERFRRETLAGDLDISPMDEEQYAAVAALPEVEVLARTAFPFITPEGSGLYPYLEFLAMVGPDGKMGRTVDRPRMLDGRMPDAERIDEMAVTETFATEADLDVGDRLAFESFAPEQVAALFGEGDPGPPGGPVVTLTVSGVAAAPDFLAGGEGASFEPRAFLSPAFHRRYVNEIGVYEGGARARLRRGGDEVPRVVEAVRHIYEGEPELEIQEAREIGDRIKDTFHVLVIALLLSALCAGVAGVVAVGQAIGRHLSRSAEDQQILTALGLGRAQRVVALVMVAVPVAVGGALVAVVVAVVASPLMPVGVARRAEPDLGVSVDSMVLGLGFVAVSLVVTALSILVAWSGSRTRPTAAGMEPSGRIRPSLVTRLVSSAGLSPVATTGARMALEAGPGRAVVPIRSAWAGTVLGVLGVVAVLVFASSLTKLVDTPESYGFPGDAVLSGFDDGAIEVAGEELATDATVQALGTVTSSLARIADQDINIYAFEAQKGVLAPVLLEGRLATRDEEVVLGSTTLRDAGADLGDVVELTGTGGPVRLRVVGRAALPFLDERASVSRGAVLTPRALAPLAPPESFNRDLVVDWAPEVDEASAIRDLEERTGAEVFPARLPPDVSNLEQVEALPRALAAFLAVLAAAALGHTLVTTVRRRRRDLAVLRAFGFVRPQVSGTVAWQATTFAVIGLAIGVPLGIVTGRVTWNLVADSIGVLDRPAIPLLALGIFALCVLILGNLMAAGPAFLARRIEPASALRTE